MIPMIRKSGNVPGEVLSFSVALAQLVDVGSRLFSQFLLALKLDILLCKHIQGLSFLFLCVISSTNREKCDSKLLLQNKDQMPGKRIVAPVSSEWPLGCWGWLFSG